MGILAREGSYTIPGKKAYALPESVSAIQRDIMKNGPVVAAFTVYSDFMHYKSGIYKVCMMHIGCVKPMKQSWNSSVHRWWWTRRTCSEDYWMGIWEGRSLLDHCQLVEYRLGREWWVWNADVRFNALTLEAQTPGPACIEEFTRISIVDLPVNWCSFRRSYRIHSGYTSLAHAFPD